MNPYRLLILILLIISVPLSTYAQSRKSSKQASDVQGIAKGFVYHDLNANQIKEADEPGIPNVLVSNSVEVAKTDANGYYELPVTGDDVFFVIKPSDWQCPLNEDNLPQFYYLHKPDGYPANFRYAGVDPTGPLPPSIDFPLYSTDEDPKFKAVVFGDPQPYTIEQVDFLADDIIAELIGQSDLKFGVTMGDVVGDDLNLYGPINQLISKIGIPWYSVLGNHDVNYMAPTDEWADETFNRVFGPATYAFEYGEVHFVVVDDVIHEDKVGSTGYIGGLRADQLTFVENYLGHVPKDHLVVLAMHIPLENHGKYFRKSDQKALFDLLKDFPNTLSISAHTHVQEHKYFHSESSDWSRDIPHHHFNVGTTSGSWWRGYKNEVDVPMTMMRDGTPNGYAMIQFNEVDYLIDWKVAGSPQSHQMNIHVPRGILAGSTDNTLLTVNFFNGCEQSEVEYRVEGLTSWKTMTKINKFDPYYLKVYERWENLKYLEVPEKWENDPKLVNKPNIGRPISNPQASAHLWEADLGTDWPVGRHVIEVRAKDRNGRTYQAIKTFRVYK
jgi:hypothetical protein